MQILRSKAPLRISLAGGGTDVSPYPEEKGGAVLNCTIDKFAYATLRVESGGPASTKVHSLDYNLEVNYEKPEDMVYNGELDLVKAAVKVLGGDSRSNGGSYELFLHSDAPPGRGLGGSSTMCVALVGAFQRYFRETWTPYDVAELAYRIERVELGWKGGRQDQYAAAFGGFNFIEFLNDRTIVNPLKVHSDVLNELAYRLLLCYTGTSRDSNQIIERQQASYAHRQKSTVAAMDATKLLAIEMKNELMRGNIDEMGSLLDQGWQLKKQFTEGISNPQIDAVYEEARNSGALGGKLVGAGGGGYLLLFCDSERKTRVARTVEHSGWRVVDFSLEPAGLQSWAVRSAK